MISILFAFSFSYHYVSIRLQIINDFVESGPKKSRNYVFSIEIYKFPYFQCYTLYIFYPPCTDTNMSIFGMVIVLAFQICILLMGFTALFSKGTQQYESWHEFPIDLLYKDVSSLDTKWRILASCPNSQYIGTLKTFMC